MNRVSNNRKHGLSRSKEYNTWCRIRLRCHDNKNQNYPNYGGRGISVCEQWINSFEAFFEHVGMAPTRKHSLDRINNNGNYEPGNVRWATSKEQARNTSRTKLIEYKGEFKTIPDWCEHLKLPLKRTKSRLRYGWTIEDVLCQFKFRAGRCHVKTIVPSVQ